MSIVNSCAAIALCLLVTTNMAGAQTTGEDDDLKRIPTATETNSLPNVGTMQNTPVQRVRIENAWTSLDVRTPAIPAPKAPPSWQDRLSLDADLRLPIAPSLTFGFSDRLNVIAGAGLSAISRVDFENDLREIYVSAATSSGSYIDIGRMNLKEGVAYGYNPTDYFKPRTGVQLSSIDPSAAREHRLGVVMIRAQQLFEEGSLMVAFAPKIANTASIPGAAPATFDLGWGRTNAENRALLAASWSEIAFNPQLLAFHDAIGTHWGASLSRVIYGNTVAYLEWSGAREASLAARAIAFGERTNVLPPDSTTSVQKRFSNDLAVGTSWTSRSNLTLNFEFHYHGSGFDGTGLAHAFAQGTSGPQGAAQFWYVRQYAADQQEPFTRREYFLRADWQDLIPSVLNLGAIAFVDQHDGSILAQFSGQYFLSRRWTLSAYVGATAGSKVSAFGSLRWRTGAVFQVARYF
jgi:hypothetical protein